MTLAFLIWIFSKVGFYVFAHKMDSRHFALPQKRQKTYIIGFRVCETDIGEDQDALPLNVSPPPVMDPLGTMAGQLDTMVSLDVF